MGRVNRRRRHLRAESQAGSKQPPTLPLNLVRNLAERRMLLVGTALVSTLIAAAPTPASAQIAVFRPLSPVPVKITNHRNCIFPGTCALINTILPGASIDFTNTGDFAVAGFAASAICAQTNFGRSHIYITNSGDLATVGFAAAGIQTIALGRRSPINIVNSGDIATAGINAYGIFAYGGYRRSDITITK
jgi:hypothetical protein